MCMQCFAEATTIEEPIMPGWYLARAQKDYGTIWMKGQYALLRENDPDFIFDVVPTLDPFFEADEALIEAAPKGLAKAFDGNMESIQDTLRHCEPYVAYKMIDAAKEVGYDPEKHGTIFAHWLQHRMALWKDKPVWAGKKLKQDGV